ncbi:hypothetical protein AYO38_09150 [bacterium SCGC AG-212-C10]|nr:hypothetical protein AYO38_09150 [bacterium SCGC AG-212-C10]
MSEESKGAVLSAMGANIAIAAGKTVAGLLTGSAAMLAEAGHSFADTVNQVFLLVGINNAKHKADVRHPQGYGREAFFWSFVVAVTIFTAGAAFAFYEGIRTTFGEHNHHRSHSELIIGFGVLGMAFLFESVSLVVAVRTLLSEARKKGWSVRRYLSRSPNLVVKTVFFEDSAALAGLAIAALGLFISELTGNEIWDGIASIAIGVLLTAVAFMLGAQSRHLLLGESADDQTDAAIRAAVLGFADVRAIVRMMTIQTGVNTVVVTGELELKRELHTVEIEQLIAAIDARIGEEVPEVSTTFWELGRRSPTTAATLPPAS